MTLAELCSRIARCENETARAGLQELLRERLSLEPYPLCGPHSIILHEAPLHCETCGHETVGCTCPPEEIRAWKCLDCGFRVSVGGRSIIDMLTPKPNPQ